MSERIIDGLAVLVLNPAACSAVEVLRLFSVVSMAVMAAHALMQSRAGRQIRRPGVPATGALEALFGQAAVSIGLNRPVRLLVVDRGAFTAGFLRTDVCIGRDLLGELDRQELKAVLLHELAHASRRDALRSWLSLFGTWMLLALSTQGLLLSQSLHPGAERTRMLIAAAIGAFLALRYLVRRPGRFLRELACDDRAVAASAEPLALASALVKSTRLGSGPAAGAAAAFSEEAFTVYRIRRLFDYRPPRLRVLLQRLLTLSVLAGALALLQLG